MSNSYLQPFTSIVDFLADFLGEDSEVVLHDLSTLEASIYKIRNGHISGRKVGDPITDLAVKALKNNNEGKLYQTNYAVKTPFGSQLKCATYYIRDVNDTIVGAMCINTVVTDFLELQSKINAIVSSMKISHKPHEAVDENLGLTIPEMVNNKIQKHLNEVVKPVSEMSTEEKKELVSSLNKEGIFLLKGAVSTVSSILNISEPTVYKYLKNLK